jgi:hypothetical protein
LAYFGGQGQAGVGFERWYQLDLKKMLRQRAGLLGIRSA